jgi:hypothetical protein
MPIHFGTAPPDRSAVQRERRATSPEALLRRHLFRVLGWAEQQTGSSVATISDGGREIGDLLVTEGRICLVIAAAPGAGRSEVLPGPVAELLEASYATDGFSAAAKTASDRAVAEARAGLLELSASGLVRMLETAGASGLSLALRGARADYEPRLTFSPAELCVAALARAREPLGGLAGELVRSAQCRSLLVMARGLAAGEQPYPIGARGLDDLPLRGLFQLVRTAHELCGAEGAPRGAADLQVVTVTDDETVWSFVGSPTRLVMIRAERAIAGEALTRAIGIAADGNRPMVRGIGTAAGDEVEAVGVAPTTSTV